MVKYSKQEHYRKPSHPDYQIIAPELWDRPHTEIQEEIRPITRQIRKESRLQQYFTSAFGAGSEVIMLKTNLQ